VRYSGRRVLRAIWVLGWLVTGCVAERSVTSPATYVVRTGDTISAIATRFHLDYRELARWNGVGADFRIDVGQILTLSPPRSATQLAPRVSAKAPAPASPKVTSVSWNWPAEGSVLTPVTQPAGGVGVRIEGVLGSPVRAAASGRVVYQGAGLRAYGRLLIIKHDDLWLSAYGYNQEVLVAEGDRVREGQQIATMGEGPGRQAMLYFEIRLNGHPVDPLAQLPPWRAKP
jgi:lipoprotein NlpD